MLRIFTDDPAVLELGGPLLLVGALFQICDAATVVTQGALRGPGLCCKSPLAFEIAVILSKLGNFKTTFRREPTGLHF